MVPFIVQSNRLASYIGVNKVNDYILFLTRSETGSVIYGCEWPFDHYHKGLLYLKEKLLSFFPLSCTEGKYYNLLF